MDLETAEHDESSSMTRRRLVTLSGAVGLGGLAAALLNDRALATPAEDEAARPNGPTAADKELLAQVIGLELAASELYRAKLEADGDTTVAEETVDEPTTAAPEPEEGEEAAVVSTLDALPLSAAILVIAENHQSFAQAVAGITGLSADTPNSKIIDENRAGFTGSDDEFFAAAHELEQAAAATHTALMGDYESDDAIELTAAVAITEARHATVFANLLGVTELDILFGNDASAFSLGEDA